MSLVTLLRECVEILEARGTPEAMRAARITIVNPHGQRVLFRGPEVQLLSEVEGRGRVYSVPVHQVLSVAAKALKETKS